MLHELVCHKSWVRPSRVARSLVCFVGDQCQYEQVTDDVVLSCLGILNWLAPYLI